MLWSGRVQNELAPEVERFLAAGDAQLLPYDCRATVIHAARLQAAGLLSDDEVAETPMPGYTHLQRAQPVTVGHHLLAWVEMLDRDRARFHFAATKSEPSPLGAAALAGSTLELPPPPGPTMRNSLDAVADRDFALDYLYACAVLFTHLSRIGEELCLWATSEFGFVRLPEEAATGSSAMPHKLNPDVAELARGKAGTAIGRLTGLLAVVKGLPLAYDRDRLAAACADPLLRTTDAAESLVGEGTPFRDAHEQVAGEVRDGTFEPPEEVPPRQAPGPADVRAAVAEARSRF